MELDDHPLSDLGGEGCEMQPEREWNEFFTGLELTGFGQ